MDYYCDGSCLGNGKENSFGGWAYACIDKDNTIVMFGSGSAKSTTNNRMELTAVIEGFRALKKDGQTVEVFTDSSYVANCFREKWYESWEKNRWRNAAKKSVENQELWKELLALVRRHNVSFYRVKGHVNLNSKSTDFDKLFEKFIGWNGARFSFEDFRYVTEMNNRADELANMGIDQVKGEV